MKITTRHFGLAILLVLSAGPGAATALTQEAQSEQTPDLLAGTGWSPTPEELDEALEKWLDQFVVYIITDEERRIFEALPTREQKLAFTERFWDIRDPTPGTRLNEYRREHFERWTIANRRFSAGKPGWATDRGRVFIIMGAPNNLSRNPTGRGGAERASESWTYNLPDNPLLPGVLDLDFVDFHGTGEFELVSDLDATAPIMTEQFGYVNNPLDVLALRRHADTIYDESFLNSSFVDPTAVGRDFLDFQQNLREILRIPEIHRERLAALRRAEVETEVIFDAFPIGQAIEFYEAIAGTTAVQTTLALDHDELLPAEFGTNQHYSTDMYVALETDGVVVDSSEKRLNFTLTEPERAQLGGTQILQSFQLLVPPGSYDLVVMARDNTSERVGRKVERLEVPNLSGDELRLSSLTLASTIEQVAVRPDEPPRDFQHGDLRVVPNVNRTYFTDQMLLLYFQAYGLTTDLATGANRVTLRGEIRRGGTRVLQIGEQHPHPAPLTRQSFSLGLPLAGYRPGVYEVEVEIVDQVAGTSRRVTADFAVVPEGTATGGR